MAEVSVIIPTFNRAQKVARAIASVLYQTYTDYELIVVDETLALNGAQLLPDMVKGLVLPGPKEIMNAAFKDVALAFPGGAQASGDIVQFEDLRAVAIHLPVATGR